jgi:colicin import membrane protein
MGKESLLKSTSKKTKSASTKKDEEIKIEKKTATAKKATAKAKAAPKAKASTKVKKTTAVRAKKAAPRPKKKKVSAKDLIHKKFDIWKPEKIFTVSPDEKYLKDFVAPPFVSGSEEETRRIKEILFKKFDSAKIKAAAEKTAAEKAADERAAAEKAADERAAAEKAADERAASDERADAEKAAEPDVSVTYDPPDYDDTISPDPSKKVIKYLIAAFVVLVALIIHTSFQNMNNYYLSATHGALEIWQGKFSPMGKELLLSLPGAQPPVKIKDVYSKTDVFPIIFDYYVEKADMLLEVSGMPDFKGVKTYLNRALSYATPETPMEAAYDRLNNIELMILLYKADVAASKATISDLKDAKVYLTQTSKLDLDEPQAEMIKQKIDAIDDMIADLQPKKKQALPEPAPAK